MAALNLMKQSFKAYRYQSILDISDLIGMIRSFTLELHVFVKYYNKYYILLATTTTTTSKNNWF